MSVLFRWCPASLPSTSQLEPSTSAQSQLLDASCVHSHRLYGNLNVWSRQTRLRTSCRSVKSSVRGHGPCGSRAVNKKSRLSKRFKTIKTVVRQLNWNPRVLCASKHLNHLSFKEETHQKDLETIETSSRRTASHCPFFRLWSLSPRRTGIEARSILVREKFWQTKSKQAKHSKLRRTRHQQKWHWRNKT